MSNRGSSARSNRWGQRRREDEARRIGADGVAHLCRGGNIAPHHPVGLGQGAVDDIDPVDEAIALCHTAAARAIHANGVHFVDIGQRVEFIRKITDRLNRAEITVHRIDRFERDQLGRIRIIGFQQGAQMVEIVVTEDPLCPAIAPNALDHRGMVQFVGVDDQAGQQFRQRAQRSVICDVSGGEQKSGLFAVQIRQFGLKTLMIHRRARDVPRAARARPRCLESFLHGRHHDRVLAHAQVVVATPNSDILFGAIFATPDGAGELALATFDVDKGAVAAFFMKAVQCGVDLVGIHRGQSHSCASSSLTFQKCYVFCLNMTIGCEFAFYSGPVPRIGAA